MDKLTVKELQALIEQKEQEKKKSKFSKKVVTDEIKEYEAEEWNNDH